MPFPLAALALGVGVPSVLLLLLNNSSKPKTPGPGTSGKELTPDAPGMPGKELIPDTSKELLSCDAAMAKLGEMDASPTGFAATAKSLLSQPKSAATSTALRNLATTLEAAAASPAVSDQQHDVLMVVATCLRAQAGDASAPTSTAKVIKDANGTPSSMDGGPPVAGVASNPNFQWLHSVQAGQSPAAIAALYFGPTAPPQRWVELIQANPIEYYSGRTLGSKGDPANPVTSGYNFASLMPGDTLRVPKTWNRWIDQEGTRRGNPLPFPNP